MSKVQFSLTKCLKEKSFHISNAMKIIIVFVKFQEIWKQFLTYYFNVWRNTRHEVCQLVVVHRIRFPDLLGKFVYSWKVTTGNELLKSNVQSGLGDKHKLSDNGTYKKDYFLNKQPELPVTFRLVPSVHPKHPVTFPLVPSASESLFREWDRGTCKSGWQREKGNCSQSRI